MAYYYCNFARADDSGNGTSPATAKKNIHAALALASSGDVVFAKNGTTYAPTAGITVSGGRSLVGYAATIGDGGEIAVNASGMPAATNAIAGGDHSYVANVRVDGARNHAFSGGGDQASFAWCRAVDPEGNGFDGGSNTVVSFCWASGADRGISAGMIMFSAATGCRDEGIYIQRAAARCLAINGSSHGFAGAETAMLAESVARGNASNGVNANNKWNMAGIVAYGNGGYGVSLPSGPHDHGGFHKVAAGSNTSGNNNVLADLGEAVVSLSGDPFANAAGYSSAATLADLFACFMPNATAGAGALLRAAGFPANLDIGASQHADAGGSSGGLIWGGSFTGGFQ